MKWDILNYLYLSKRIGWQTGLDSLREEMVKHYILETHMKFNQVYFNHVHIFVELDVMNLGLMEEKLEIVF